MAEDILSTVQELWSAGESIHSMQENRWAKNKKLATSRHITTRKLGQSSLFVPKIESFHSRKQADYIATFGGEDPVSLKETLSSTKAGARILETVVNYYVTDAGINWKANVLNAAHDALTYNFAPWIIDWDRGVETINSVVRELDDEGETITQSVKQEVETHSFPTIENIPPEDIRVDPAIGWDEIGLARFGVVRRYRDRTFAERMHKAGAWPEIPENMYLDGMSGTQVLASERAHLNSPFDKAVDIDNGLLEILYTYYYEEFDGELTPSLVVTLKDMMVLEDPAPLEFDISNADSSDPWPWGVARIYVEPHELYSRAMPEKLEDMQLETNARRNQRLDNVALILNREKFMTPEAGVDPAVLSRSFAGKVTTVKTPGSVWWDAPPDVTASSYQEETLSVNDMEGLVSESAQRTGQSAPRKESATETKIAASNSATALGLDVTVYSITGPERWVEKIIRMVRLAADPSVFEEAARSIGVLVEDPYQEALTGDFRVKVGAGAHQAAKDIAISNASNIAAIIQSIYGPAAQYNEIMRPMLEDNGYNPDNILPAPQGQPQLAPQDLGGMAGDDNLTVQPNVALTGGQFPARGAS